MDYEEYMDGNKYFLAYDEIGDTIDAVFIWKSGNKLVAMAFDDWQTDIISEEDLFTDILNAYFAKYPSDLEITTCVDSDEGVDYSIRGIAVGPEGTDKLPKADFCKNDDTIIEHFCQDSVINTKQYACPVSSNLPQ